MQLLKLKLRATTQLSNNYRHGAYMQDHGSCSITIIEAFDPEDDALALHDEEIEHLIECMGGANRRHEDTGYDAMRADGISRDNAREYVSMGL
jgi:hypothetical protein